MKTAARAYGEVFQILEKNRYQIQPVKLKKTYNRPKIAKAVLKITCAMPFIAMADGDFAESFYFYETRFQFKSIMYYRDI